MTKNPHRAISYARSHHAEFLSELKEFLRFPSESSEPKRAADVGACAIWLARHLQKIGMRRVRLIRTQGHPLVYASWQQASRAPVLLIYGHYDVVPAAPLEQWETPPYRPTVRNQNLYARGACDDKGQLFCHVKALESVLRAHRALPLNVKCIFEGEEEIGSCHLLSFIEKHREVLRADVAVISDTKMLDARRPAISYAQRGGLRAELEVRGPGQELHSGTFGGAVLNPLQALCKLLAGFHDERGRINIPGFYDDVRNWSDEERSYMQQVGPADRRILDEAQVEHGWGEQGYTAYERTTIRPALTLNGISGGHAGKGVKGVVPAKATAKLSFRLVPDQDPQRIARIFREHIARACPSAVQCTLRLQAPTMPVLFERDHPALQAASIAYEKAFGSAPVFLRSGGSIPVAGAFQKVLNIPVVLMGFGLPDDRIHGPNEKMHLPNFYRGIETSIRYMNLISEAIHHGNISRPVEASEWVT
ncbi:dipeptidase [Silvibacterium acidisoli]|uniref:dipeptidase n=1 Tax=Acidobacteriaceae bacterium ZG23-2 TaxID=2883246 RepID=UPI00406CD9E9